MFDMLKGVIMLLILLFHTYGLFDTATEYASIPELIRGLGVPLILLRLVMATIGAALIPTLFIISGYGFRKTSFKKCVSKQFWVLIMPFVITAIITTFFYTILVYLTHLGWLRFTAIESLKRVLGFALGLSKETVYFGIDLNTCGPIWFLIGLFIGNVVFNLLANRFEEKKLLIASAVTAFIGWLSGIWITLPWSISQGLVAVLFICIGYLAKKNKCFMSPIGTKKVALMVIVLIVAFMMISLGDFNMAEGDYTCGALSIIEFGILGILITHLFLYLNRFNGVFSNALRKIGRVSLYVMCVHTVEVLSFGSRLRYEFMNGWKGSIFARSMIIFSVRTVVVLLGTYCVVKLKDFYNAKKQHKN